MVAVYHPGWWAWRDDPLIPSLAPWVAWGWVGVPVFFVISGFVIAFSAEGRPVGKFVRRRASRLYPASWICATLIFVAVPTPLGNYLRTMILSPIGPWVSGVYWTLAIELMFYSLVAIALWRGWDLAKVALCLGFYSSAFWFLRAANVIAGKPLDFTLLENNEGYLLLLHDGIFFAFGMLLQQRRYGIAAAGFLVAGFVAITARSHALANPGPFTAAPLIWLASTMLIVCSAFYNRHVSRWVKYLPTRTIGLMTYPLYLVHAEIGRAVMRWSPFDAAESLLLGLGAVILVSLAVLPLEAQIRRRI